VAHFNSTSQKIEEKKKRREVGKWIFPMILINPSAYARYKFNK